MSDRSFDQAEEYSRLRALYIATSAQSDEAKRYLFQEMLVDEMRSAGFGQVPHGDQWRRT